MLVFVCLALMMASVSSAKIYTACVDHDPIISYEIDGCAEPPCTFARGSTVHAKVTFIAPFSSDTLVRYGHWLIGSYVMPGYTMNDCKHLNSPGQCPIVAGNEYTVEYDMFFPSDLETGTGSATYIRKDENCNVITCTKVDVIIV